RIGGVAIACDLGNAESVAAMAEAAGASGDIDILVNNAGVTHLPALMEDVSEDDFDRVLRINAKSIYLTARAFVPGMKARGKGAILNMASTAAVSPRPRLNWYNASKGWVVTATKAMAIELAPFGVRVNALNPVAGETPLLKSFMGEDTPEIRARFLASIPMGRFSTPEDLANAALFLCSDEASLVTGVAMEVDGGRCI
ncbi:MAG: glucose 1-dehydrogenase, partial [Paracoccaceae bacterium]